MELRNRFFFVTHVNRCFLVFWNKHCCLLPQEPAVPLISLLFKVSPKQISLKTPFSHVRLFCSSSVLETMRNNKQDEVEEMPNVRQTDKPVNEIHHWQRGQSERGAGSWENKSQPRWVKQMTSCVGCMKSTVWELEAAVAGQARPMKQDPWCCQYRVVLNREPDNDHQFPSVYLLISIRVKEPQFWNSLWYTGREKKVLKQICISPWE